MNTHLKSRTVRGKVLPIVFALAALLAGPSAQARVPGLDPLIGHGLDVALRVAGASNLEFTSKWKRVNDPSQTRRVQGLVRRIQAYGAADFRYGKIQIAVIEGDPSECNAFSTGPTVYVTESALKQLDDRRLTALLAHELAHAEEGHLAQGSTFGLAAVLIQFGRLVASDVRSLVNGAPDAFMQDLWDRGHWAMIEEMLIDATLGQEMQADCMAYQWLLRMQRLGFDNDPEDLVDAIVGLVGVKEEWLSWDDFTGARVRAIRSGHYRSGRCE